ncbi:MAG: hypothetical protein ABSA15_05920 [Thermoplasmata archaeon]
MDADGAADEFILMFLTRLKAGSVTADQVWKSSRSRGLVPSSGDPSGPNDPDEGAAIVEIRSGLEEWLNEGSIGGEQEPEPVAGDRRLWVLGNAWARR